MTNLDARRCLDARLCLFDLTYKELETELTKLGQPKFRAKQLSDWIYKKLVFDPEQMRNLPQSFKDLLLKEFSLYLPVITDVSHSKSDDSYKFLLKTDDNKKIESILMLDEKRTTLCVSCMIGCPLACKFCATGMEIGFVRKLTPAEIVGQYLAALKYAQEHKIAERITNIVFMGMGEPFLNLEAVKKSIWIMTNQNGIALSPSKISVSTAGSGSGIGDFIT